MERKIVNGDRSLIIAVLMGVSLIFTLAPQVAFANADDYHPETGEPKCFTCHTKDRKYSIDYTREESCLECHDPGLSTDYISIEKRFQTAEPLTSTPPREILAVNKEVVTGVKSAERTKSELKGTPPGMVLVPAGSFTMGSNDWWPKSQPEHTRKLKDFYIDRYEVTNTRYMEFVKATGHKSPRHWVGGVIPETKAEHPVVYVTWFDAEQFCAWDGKRLPSEPEWEKGARGADKRDFPWGKKFDKNKGNTPQYGNEDTMSVGSFPSGVSPYGLHDMAGNAFEWTADWFTPYPGNNHPDENYGELYRVVRGGSWYDCTYYKCGISAPTYNRIFFNPYTQNNNFGFRCSKDLNN